MKILVIRFSSIGDIVLTTPILRCIKQQLPGTTIHYLTKSSFRPVLAGNPHLDKIYYLEDSLEHVITELKKEHYDHVVDLHRNLRSNKVKRALKAPNTTFPKLNIRKWLLVNMKINVMPDKSIVERYFEAVKTLNVRSDGEGLDYYIPDYIKLRDNDIPMSHWAGYVAFVIGGSYNTKKLPVAKWIELCQLIPYPIMLLGDKNDFEDGGQIAKTDNIRIYNACGKFNLNESAVLIKLSRLVLSNDTGLMHIAAALDKTIISFWGNTSPEMGMFPYFGKNNLVDRPTKKSLILENKELSCHPCSKLGYDKCPKKHFRCMNDININIASDIVKEYMQIAQR